MMDVSMEKTINDLKANPLPTSDKPQIKIGLQEPRYGPWKSQEKIVTNRENQDYTKKSS